jgi:gamma-glutamyl:cysteine ligase YbdK (ATP-grasp superfamily)
VRPLSARHVRDNQALVVKALQVGVGCRRRDEGVRAMRVLLIWLPLFGYAMQP